MDVLQEANATMASESSSNAGLKSARVDDSNKAETDLPPAAEIKADAPAVSESKEAQQEESKPKVQPKQQDKRRHSHHQKKKHKSKKSHRKEVTSDTSDSDSESSDSDSSDSESESGSDSDRPAKHATKRKTKRHSRKDSRKFKTHGRSKKQQQSDSESSSESSSSSDESDDEPRRRSGKKTKQKYKGRSERHGRRRNRRRGHGRRRRDAESDSDSDSDSSSSSDSNSNSDDNESEREQEDDSNSSNSDTNDAAAKIVMLRTRLDHLQAKLDAEPQRIRISGRRAQKDKKVKENKKVREDKKAKEDKKKRKQNNKKSKKQKTGFKRVDQLWDDSIHDYKLTESAGDKKDEFDGYVFNVRRQFDWENKYRSTVVDVNSKALREVLQHVMKDVRGISLVEDKPAIDPNMLFLYLEELRTHARKTLKARLKSARKSRERRRLKAQIAHCKVLVGYLDHDYKETKQTLYPMLEAGNITFDLLWALFKPNTIAFTTTYGAAEHPRCFKVDYATRESSFMRGEWYCVEGRYLEYDGKTHGLGDFYVDVDSFKGARSIASLATYPLAYHKDRDSLKPQLVERGKKFVSMCGMSYRFHKGLAFVKKKKSVQKVNINGRVMVDPAIFRRVNPNYPISIIKAAEDDDVFVLQGCDDDDDDSDACSCCSSGDEGGGRSRDAAANDQDVQERVGYKLVEDPKRTGSFQLVEVPVDADGNVMQREKIEQIDTDGTATEAGEHVFSDEELLIASPVVLGFAFSEKLWLEFSVSSVRDIEWNEGAFDSLMLPTNQKSIVRALVESHKLHAAKTIDDVVQGKGRGLVSVLHGPPGTGKTLTAEGIAELLRCPLYMVSAGELGTQPDRLEAELQRILDIAHSWGAVLLLDEADVFLERREASDMHRNALVSIFLRLLEYFQGILFLTTNRVETFDDAFQSRIHIALRYGELAVPARRAVWKLFLDKVRAMEQSDEDASTEVKEEAVEVKEKAGAVGEEKNGGEAKESTSPSSSDASTPALASSTASVASGSSPSSPSSASSSSKKTSDRPIDDSELDGLARRQLNGRQIKNAVRTAQALAVNEHSRLTAEHVRRVIDVAEQFERDLRGGLGWEDAMRCYT